MPLDLAGSEAPAAPGAMNPGPPAAEDSAPDPGELDAPNEPAPPVVEDDPTGHARRCSAPAGTVLLDFEAPNNGVEQALFGDFESVLSGGTFVYPSAGAPLADTGTPLGLSSDVTTGAWRLLGSITQQAGFGLFLDCQLLDASGFDGIAFRIAGDLEGAGDITFMVSTAGNDVARSWLLERNGSAPSSFGRCIPSESEFDGSCAAARIAVPVSAEPRDVVVRFADLSYGSPEDGVNPVEVTGIAWSLPPPVRDAQGAIQPFTVSLRIDDIRFLSRE